MARRASHRISPGRTLAGLAAGCLGLWLSVTGCAAAPTPPAAPAPAAATAHTHASASAAAPAAAPTPALARASAPAAAVGGAATATATVATAAATAAATAHVATAAASADIAAGQRVFARCASCHQIGGTAGAFFGPQLTGIVNRPAAATGDFAYSPAMKAERAAGLVWTEQNLAAFIRDPSKTVPGTSMRFWGLSDARQIADLIAYLRSVK